MAPDVYRKVDGLYTGAVSSMVNGVCTVVTPPGLPLYSIGRELTDADFVELAITRTGTQRIVVTTLRATTGEALRTSSFLDTQRGDQLCYAYQAIDGKLRCLPAHYFSYQYADAACTQPSISVYLNQPVPASVSLQFYNQVDNIYHCYDVGARLNLTSVFEKNTNGGCTATPVSPDSTVYQLSAELPATVFAELERLIE